MAPGLFWFFLGAGAATYYIDKKQNQKSINYPHSYPNSPPASSYNSSCNHHAHGEGPAFQSPPIQAPPVQQFPSQSQQNLDTVIPEGGSTTDPHQGYSFRRWSWGGVGVRDEHQMQGQGHTQAHTQAHDQTQGQGQPFAFPWQWHHPGSGWDDESARERMRVKMREFGRRADDVMTDLSDATLDALTTTVELLRDKLVEHRLQREQAKASQGQGKGQGLGEGEKMPPTRYV